MSYTYNVVCDVCGCEFKNYELRKRWDGFMVCKDDWEQRNILDFYQVKDDTHQLPYTRPNDGDYLTFTPSFVNLTETAGTGTIESEGSYWNDTINSKVQFTVQITITGNATTAASSATVSLPGTSVSAGTVRVFDGNGSFLGTGTIGSAATTATLPNWITKNSSIIISGQYGS